MIFEGTRIFERNHLRNEASNSKQNECGRFLGVRCRKEAIAAEVGEQWRVWGFRKTVGYSGGSQCSNQAPATGLAAQNCSLMGQ